MNPPRRGFSVARLGFCSFWMNSPVVATLTLARASTAPSRLREFLADVVVYPNHGHPSDHLGRPQREDLGRVVVDALGSTHFV